MNNLLTPGKVILTFTSKMASLKSHNFMSSIVFCWEFDVCTLCFKFCVHIKLSDNVEYLKYQFMVKCVDCNTKLAVWLREREVGRKSSSHLMFSCQ